MTAPAIQSPPAPPSQRRAAVEWIATIIVIAIVVVGIDQLLRSPPFVNEVRVSNRSNLMIDVDASGAARDGWLPVAIARPNDTVATSEVLDQGDTWVFRFHAGGHNGGELRVSRDQLARARWTIAIPNRVIDRLQQANAGDL